jgi:hypothetical protein
MRDAAVDRRQRSTSRSKQRRAASAAEGVSQ